MKDSFSISVIGLGLIGASMAYALKGFRNCVITGYNRTGETLKKALDSGCIDKAAYTVNEAVTDADLVIFCTYPSSIIEDIKQHVPYFKKGTVITEICGVKTNIQDAISNILPREISYIGLHPMAGKEVAGFDNADAALFKNAGFILTVPDNSPETAIKLIYDMSEYVGAGRIVVNTPEEHDEIIAYTSSLMHISAAALCADYPADMTQAHTAGAFRDCTRIADISAGLWTELFILNSRYILPHLTKYINELEAFKNALENNDDMFINKFLERSRKNKEEMKNL